MSTPIASAFAVTAETMLAELRFAEAMHLCARGVTEFPNYVGGYVMLAKAYEALGQHHDATVMRTAAQERFPWYEPIVVVPKQAVRDVQPTHIEVDEPEVVIVAEPVHREQPSVLRMIDTAHLVNDERIIRSASVRFLPLHEAYVFDVPIERQSLLMIQPYVALAVVHLMSPSGALSDALYGTNEMAVDRSRRKCRGVRAYADSRSATTCIRVRESTEHSPAPEPNGPTLITETIARIYMQQGSYDRAIDAFRMLQRSKPDKHAQFEALIAECERARAS